jgi:hypothetical protein
MPGVIEAITFLAIAGQAGALGAGVTAVVGAYGSIIAAVASIGLSYLSSVLFQPEQPKPEDVQVSVKNPTAPRQRHYGRVKTTGPWIFGATKEGRLFKILALGTGRLDAIEEHWIDDTAVTLDVNGRVETDPWGGADGQGVIIETRLGLSTETYYDALETYFPEYTSDHRGDGVASLFATQGSASAESFSELFPNGVNTLYRVVARASRVFNPSTETTAWSDNAAAVIRDYMTHADGMRLSSSLMTTTQATAGWLAAYNRCAEQVDKKAGGTEDAYRLWGTYTFDERPADVLGRMMQCCDARVVPTPDGGVTLDIGTWEEPTVILDEDAITGFADVTHGRDITTTANIIRATYLSPIHDYQATDADPWIDEDDVAARGEIVQDAAFNMAPSHGQARRLMKLAAYRANPTWVGTWTCNLRGLAAFGKRFVRLQYPLFEIDEVVEVVDFRFNIQKNEDGIPHLIGVTLQVQSMPEEAYEWDAEAEEGTEPISEDVTVDNTIPVPENFTFVLDHINVGSQSVPVGVISFDEPPAESLDVVGQYRKDELGAEWQVIPIAEDATSAQTGALTDGGDYEARVHHVTITGRVGEWSDIETINVVADVTAPSQVSDLGVVVTNGTAVVTFTSPNDPSSRLRSYRVYRWPSSGSYPGDAVDVSGERAVAPNTAVSFTDSVVLPESDTYVWGVVTENYSDVQSAIVESDAYAAGYDVDALAYINALSVKPGGATLWQKYSTLAEDLKAAGLWSKLKSLALLKNATEEAALLDFRVPSRVFTNNGATFVANSYMAGNGSSAWVDIGVSPGTAGASQNSITLGANVVGGTDAANALACPVGVTGAAGLRLSPRASGDVLSARLNAGSAQSFGAAATIVGRSFATRRGSTDSEGYKAGTSTGTDATASTSMAGSNLCLFRSNTNYSDFQVTDVVVLEGISDTEAADLDAALAAYIA